MVLGIEYMLTNIITNVINNLSPEIRADIETRVKSMQDVATGLYETAQKIEQRLTMIEIRLLAIEAKFRGDIAGDIELLSDPAIYAPIMNYPLDQGHEGI